ncbi:MULTISPECIES: ATP-binding protein [Chryseobacterium]|uniref:ATP-binding protein n=1 Tax=Candidatus Chryseobacterium massiliense TaxID=204089 RepID=A0A3D9B3K5_9FLAO|nr:MULTISPECIES: ATP-binding protein [Chryseobacterium]REC47846.1 ATP-binding protein [Candidatus Chryseobacterium massiliae]
MTNLQKNEIVILIENEKNRLGSYAKVATKCDVSTAMISNMINKKWDLIKPEMWSKVGSDLGFDDSEWRIAETMGYKKVANICTDAKNEAFFMILSTPSGRGKTKPLEKFYEQNSDNEVFYILCREWAKREFLVELCKSLGIDSSKHYVHVDKLGAKVSEFFKQRKGKKPLLIVDDAGKLRDSAIRWFIHLFDDNEDHMGCLLAGTEYLEKRIRDGVRLKKLGFDEIESRFGRTYLSLIGTTQKDAQLICSANGIHDKALQNQLFAECNPLKKIITTRDGNQSIEVIEDIRRLKRAIKREKLKLQYA